MSEIALMIRKCVLSIAGNAPKFIPVGAPSKGLNHHQPWSIVPLMARLVKTPSPKYVNGTRKSACHNCMTQVRISRQQTTATAYSPPVFKEFLTATNVSDQVDPGIPLLTLQFHSHCARTNISLRSQDRIA